VLEVLGDMTFEGDLVLEFVDGFSPRAADEFEILVSCGNLELAAEQIEVVNLALEFEFNLARSAGTVKMTAPNDAVFVPEPGRVASLLTCLVTLGMLARCREHREGRPSR